MKDNKAFLDEKSTTILAVIAVIIVSAILISILSQSGKPTTPEKSDSNLNNANTSQTSTKNFTYQILSSEHIPYFDKNHPDWQTKCNLMVLLHSNDLSRNNLQKALTEIKDANCTDPVWNIDAYDDVNAYELDNKQSDKDQEIEDQEIEKEVADHYIANLHYDGEEDSILYYPYQQDLQYKVLGPKKSKSVLSNEKK